MSFASIGTLGTSTENSSDTSAVLTTSAQLDAGNLGIIAFALDNFGTTDADHSEVTGVVDSAGNVWEKLHEYTNGQGSAGAGATVSVWMVVAGSTLALGGTITGTLGNAVTAKAISAWEYSKSATATVVKADATEAVGDGADPAAISLAGLAPLEYLFFHAIAIESTAAAYTQDADYTSIDSATGGGAGAASMSIFGGFRIATLTGDTVDVAYGAARDHVQVLIALREEEPEPEPEPEPQPEAQAAPVPLPGQIFQAKTLSLHAYSPAIGSYDPEGVFAGDYGEAIVAWEHELGADGEFISARFELGGQYVQIEDWLEKGLGRHIVCFAPEGDVIWEGFVNVVEARLGGLGISRGPLMDIGNRESVAFTPILDETQDPPLTGPPTTTTIAEDADSQAAYGIIEKVISGGTITDEAAEQLRDTWLAENSLPVTSSEFALGQSGGEFSLIIHCLGYVEWLKQYVYNQTASSASVTLDTKIEAVLAADPNGLLSTDYELIEDNGLLTSSYESEDRDAFTIIREMVDQGDVNDNRYVFGVTLNQRVYYKAIPTTVRYSQSVYSDGQVLDGNSVVPPWRVKAGEFLRFTDFLVGRSVPSTLRADPRVMFIERVTYTAPFGLRLSGGKVSKLPQYLARLGLGNA